MAELLAPSLTARLSSPVLRDHVRLLHRSILQAEHGRLGWERRESPALLAALCADLTVELTRRGDSPMPCEHCRVTAAQAAGSAT